MNAHQKWEEDKMLQNLDCFNSANLSNPDQIYIVVR